MDSEHEALSDKTGNNLSPRSDIIQDVNQTRLDAIEKKAVHLRLILEKDFKAADLRWSLFVAAALSFRYEACLRPFPPGFLKNNVKDMDELLSVISEVPALDLLLQKLDNLDNLAHFSHIIDLLFYVLVRLKEPTLKSIPLEAHESILMNVNSATLPAVRPHHIFQVLSSSKVTAEVKWKELALNNNIFYAFHGNKLENFYSILHFGLQLHMNKNTVIGNGIYLSQELNVTLPYSNCGFGWGASCLGGHLSCVAMCEVIDAPQGINYQKPAMYEGDTTMDENKDRTKSVLGPNPETHYIVTNCDLIRVRYLLVYAKQPASMRFSSVNIGRQASGVRYWFTRHKLFSILLGYGLMLATIGFANNQPMHYYYQLLMKKLDLAYNTVKV